MIGSVKDKRVFDLLQNRTPKRFPPDIVQAARRRLRMLEAAKCLEDLREPSSNRLERLIGDRAGQYSIRINRQWRICFHWDDNRAHNIEITDYH